MRKYIEYALMRTFAWLGNVFFKLAWKFHKRRELQ